MKYKKYFLYSIGGLLLLYIIWVYAAVYAQLPTLTADGLRDMNFSQTSTITTKEWKSLYKFYEQNREYIDYAAISPVAVNAFVAIEDQSFRENDGVDVMGIFRAFFSTVTSSLGLGWRRGWASTITQQLLKNILWLDEGEEGMYDKIVRKHKERVLVGKLSNVIEEDIKKHTNNLSADEVTKRKKEKVMELYLNYIYLGNQAYGVQAAAQSYFGVKASDLSIVQSAILASMPQRPTYYNPYKHPERVIGVLSVRDAAGLAIVSGEVLSPIIAQLGNTLINDGITIGQWNNKFQNYLVENIPSTITVWSSLYQLSYTIGRKDAVLNRMYEDNYITQDQLKRAFVDGLSWSLKPPFVDIKAPHFIFWIRDLLQKDPRFADLGITEDILYQWWLTIKTSLDDKTQDIAEKAIAENMPILHDRWWNNRSMLYIDTTNGDVLAYVWSADYNNESIDGKVDMVRSPRQPWSSVKPLIYSYALQTLPLTLDTPVYDIPLSVWSFTPNNADAKFEGLLPLRFALAHSRNIPAVKVYFAAGKEPALKPYLQKLGLTSLRNSTSYGYSLALGAGEVPMLEMAQAYSQLSQKWQWYEINPILEIRWSDGQILYQKTPKLIESGLKEAPAYLIWKILSSPENMPAWWTKYYSIAWLTYAVKSGTSNKVIGNKSYPRDGWLATYTPSRVAMYWAGNANDKPMNSNALWLLLNSEVNKSFYKGLIAEKLIQNEQMVAADITTVSLSKVTGKAASSFTPEEYVVNTLAYNAPDSADSAGTYVPLMIDTSCGKNASPLTPSEQRQRAYLIQPRSITTLDIENITQRYTDGNKTLYGSGGLPRVTYNYPSLFVAEPEWYCEWRWLEMSDEVTLTTSLVKDQSLTPKTSISFSASSTTSPIKTITVSLNDTIISTYRYNDLSINDAKTFTIRSSFATGNYTIQVTALTEDGKAQAVIVPVTLVTSDADMPFLETGSVSVQASWTGYAVSFRVSDQTSWVKTLSWTTADGNKGTNGWGNVSLFVASLSTLSYAAVDMFDNKSQGTIDLVQYQ